MADNKIYMAQNHDPFYKRFLFHDCFLLKVDTSRKQENLAASCRRSFIVTLGICVNRVQSGRSEGSKRAGEELVQCAASYVIPCICLVIP